MPQASEVIAEKAKVCGMRKVSIAVLSFLLAGCVSDKLPGTQAVCFEGDKIVYSGPGEVHLGNGTCMVLTNTTMYVCTGCATHK